MKTIWLVAGLGAACASLAALPGCATRHGKATAMEPVPNLATLTTAPLRNRVRFELRAPVPEVWALLGDLRRFPEYSSGLERVEPTTDARGRCTEYVCHFKAEAGGGVGVVHRELVRWYAPQRGYASSGDEGNAFGLTNDLNLVTLEPSREGTIVTWDVYYDAQDVELMKASYDQALVDIRDNLLRRFGGRSLEHHVEKPR